MTTADQFDSVLLPPGRTSTIIDQRCRTWRRCKGCLRHYLTETNPLVCPRRRLAWGAKPGIELSNDLHHEPEPRSGEGEGPRS